MMDETPTQVLKEDGRRAKTKSYFWVIRTGEDELNQSFFIITHQPELVKTSKILTVSHLAFYFMTDGYRG